jgi:hypothetical protein
MKWSQVLGVALGALVLGTSPAFPTAQQIGPGDTALLFGGSDAEGGIGDWYLGNGVVEAIIDHVGVQTDLVGVLPPGTEPAAQSEINPTGGTIIDLARVGTDGDQLPQMFTVGGLSTSNFFLHTGISAPDANTIRVTGGILFPPTSVAPTPCLTVVTDYQALGADPFITITSVATNGCGVALTTFQGLLDVFIWTQRHIIPFSGAGFPAGGGGKGFNHPVLDLANPGAALELPVFMGGPGVLDPADGIVDAATATTSGEVSYGLLGVSIVRDPDGPGATPPDINSPVNTLFGVSGTLVTALGNFITGVPGGTPAGGTLTYTRRLYVGDRNDVRSVSNAIFPELATRPLALPVINGTISGNIDAADDPNVEATILIKRLGRCTISLASCKTNADCTGGGGSCADPVPTTGQFPDAYITQIRTDAAGAFSGVVLPRGDYELVIESAERDDVTVSPVVVAAALDTPVVVPPLSARGTVAFAVTERRPGSPQIPARLTFVGVGATPDPRFNHDLTARVGVAPFDSELATETGGGTQAGTAGHAAGQGNVVYTATGSGSIQVRPGTYDIYASRGSEYSVDLVSGVNVTAGGTANVAFRIKRAVKTKNAISADFHIHTGRSLDTGAAVRDRIAAFAGEGVEVLVSTDHDIHTDFAPTITDFALDSQMTSIIGNEVTGSVPAPPAFPNSFGHINAWPLPLDPNAKRDGAIEDEFVAPNWVFKRLRDQGAEVIQYNHPRAGVSGITSIGYFNNIGCNRCENDVDTTCNVDADCPAAPPPQNCTCVGYQPDRTIATPPNDILLDDGILGPGTTANTDGLTNLDFDVMEIQNAVKDTDFPGYRQVRFDWLSLLQQGIFKPATGVSDSHRITVEHAGWARSYVLGVGDDPAALDVTDFNDAIKAGAMLVGGGPYIEFSVQCGTTKGGMGALVNCPTGTTVKLKIKVRTPAWMPIEEVRVIANGDILDSWDSTTMPKVRPTPANFESNGRTARFRKTLTVTPTVDTYYIVEAGPKFPANINDLPTSPPIVDIVQPDVVPNSITNPIFIDRNNNAAFEPPGLPVLLTASADQAAPKGFWQRVTEQLWQVAARWRGEAIAEGNPGKMTGVTEAEKREAVKEGEYFPLHEFGISPEVAAEAARKAAEAEQKALENATPPANTQ